MRVTCASVSLWVRDKWVWCRRRVRACVRTCVWKRAPIDKGCGVVGRGSARVGECMGSVGGRKMREYGCIYSRAKNVQRTRLTN